MKKNDRILIGALLGAAVVLLLAMFFVKQNTVNGEAVILVEGKEYARYPLSEDREIKIPGLLGENILIIQDGQAWMAEAVCPDKICMDFGKIRYNTEMIVCRPGSIVVIIENGEASGLDAVGQ
ncbi:MAG: NusG domain II-containing protein [Lachnospiraceae bacterium]|nr:NusG domain II-containing protein [Lachnospiraceae bacterium]